MCTHICTHMSSVNISLRKDVYQKLSAFKSDEESFSDAIENLLKSKDLERYFGVLSGITKEEIISMEKANKELRTMEALDNLRGE